MLSRWINTANANGAVWLDDVQHECERSDDCSCVIIEITLFSGKKRAYTRFFPSWKDEEQRSFVKEYFCACVFNILSALGGSGMTFYIPRDNAGLSMLIAELDEVFQLHRPVRSGYGKVVSEANRICAFLKLPPFGFVVRDLTEYQPPAEKCTQNGDYALVEHLRDVAAKAAHGVHCGIDVGGTDIKLAVSAEGQLVCTREYDWNPAGFDCAEKLIAPIVLLTRLARACAADYLANGAIASELRDVLDKAASDAAVECAVERAQARLGTAINVLDSVGLSFPDVVLRDAILGGETPKTQGMRENAALDYEQEFAKITQLAIVLESLCCAPGHVRVTNDGNIAAYTAAIELAHSDNADLVERGVLAHSLGTDLGTGWLDAQGKIPELTLELYDSIIDLGSRPARELPAVDLRCVRNENSGLAGVRRYMGQAAVFRMVFAAERGLVLPFTEECDGALLIRTAPYDMRKPCLEHIMAQAECGNAAAEEVFRQIGRNLAHVSCETAALLQPETTLRFIFGRFVKRARCFALICEGFDELETGMRLVAADSALACTPLMRMLDATDGVTVAQFGQAVGAVYFGMT